MEHPEEARSLSPPVQSRKRVTPDVVSMLNNQLLERVKFLETEVRSKEKSILVLQTRVHTLKEENRSLKGSSPHNECPHSK